MIYDPEAVLLLPGDIFLFYLSVISPGCRELDCEPDLAQEALWNEITTPVFTWALSSIG